jgi:hypothetical protein
VIYGSSGTGGVLLRVLDLIILAALLGSACASSSQSPDTEVEVHEEIEVLEVVVEVAEEEVEATLFCNGSELLCSRRYNEVAFACTHNAMSSEEDGWWGPNQLYNIPTQLEDGVRAFMLDTHYDEEAAFLCHGLCALGKRPLADGLADLTSFLESDPNQVLTIIFESYISAEDTRQAFADSGLLEWVYAHPAGEPWPTLQELIGNHTTVVVFTDSGGGTYPWYHPVWDHAWETHYSNVGPDDFTCEPNRGNPENPLFIFNHFLTDPLAKPELAELVNYNPFFLERALECHNQSGRMPNFVTIDFYSIGDVMEVVEELNFDL